MPSFRVSPPDQVEVSPNPSLTSSSSWLLVQRRGSPTPSDPRDAMRRARPHAAAPDDDTGTRALVGNEKALHISQRNCEVLDSSPASPAESEDAPERKRAKAFRWTSSVSLAAPFAAAIMAPLSTLLDIPGLSQRWYLTDDGGALPDPRTNVALSALGLAFNLVANALLIFRFSTGAQWWRSATIISTAAWWLKTIIAAINVAVFSTYRGAADATLTTLSGGFWAAVASLTLASIISLLLGGHLVWEAVVIGKEHSKAASIDARTAGRHFQVLVMLQIVLIALFAVLVAFVEEWTYTDAIYYSIVTLLTIGYGDLTPSHTSTRVVLFFYALVSIAFLANLVGEIASWLSDRQSTKRAEWRIRTEAQARRHADHQTDNARRTLGEEIAFLKQVARSQDQVELLSELGVSFAIITAYWMLGAMVFALIHGEDLGFGTSTYMIYVTFLTIGYGDFSPTTPGGRVFFIVYALAGVPVITSFAVQTFTAILSTVTDRKFEEFRIARTLDDHHEAYRPHGRLVLHYLSTTDSHLTGADFDLETLSVKPVESPAPAEKVASDAQREEAEREDPDDLPGGEAEHDVHLADADPDPLRRKRRLVQLVIDLSLRLEAKSRRLLINTLDPGSPAQLLLRADLNIQARDVRVLASEMRDAEHDETASVFGQLEDNTLASPTEDTLQLVGEYRSTFAALLAASSRLKDLEGLAQCHFERRLTEDQMPKQSVLPFPKEFARATKADSSAKAIKRMVTMA